MRHRLATTLALALMPLAACGGDDGSDSGDGKAKSSSTDVVQNSRQQPERARAGKPAPSRETTEKRRKRDKPAGKESQPPPRTLEEALERAPLKRQAELIEQAARVSAQLAGLEPERVQIRERGKLVNLVVGRQGACGAGSADVAAIEKRIREAVPTVDSVTVEVAGTGESLAAYGPACSSPIPNGPGRVVLQQSGDGGPVTTRWFNVRGDRWAVEYENAGGYLSISPIARRRTEGEDLYPVAAQKRRTGRKVYSVGPGTYRLQIFGSGRWTVRVKDIR